MAYYQPVVRLEPSPRVRELIREAAWIALHPSQDWLDAFDQATLAAYPSIGEDPALAAIISRSNRTNLIHFAAANLREPGASVPPNLGAEQVRMARELVRRGVDSVALEVYRIGHNVALRRWTEIVFGLTSDPAELRELLDGPVRSANEFVDATLAGLAAQMQQERDQLTRDIHAQRHRIVENILDGAPFNSEQAEAKLGYPLDGSHTAMIIWSDEPDDYHNELDRAAEAVVSTAGSPLALTVVPDAATRWLWSQDAAGFDITNVRHALSNAPGARAAIGTTAPGMDGFRTSHFDALTTQRTLARMRSTQRVALFGAIEMVALLTHDLASTDKFIANTLGDFESASRELHATLLAFIRQQCNASRAAKVLYIHRNTLLHRVEAAQKLLPRPLDETTLHVGIALEVLQWRGDHAEDYGKKRTEQQPGVAPTGSR
ncbi:PucR family transcriptional regulator [Mycobacterium spongiae]|uniref:Rv1453 family transcriptional regulator n=1 Tax=Mycobacterium spongiae TaxID=886343 RepID=UPI003CCEDAFC